MIKTILETIAEPTSVFVGDCLLYELSETIYAELRATNHEITFKIINKRSGFLSEFVMSIAVCLTSEEIMQISPHLITTAPVPKATDAASYDHPRGDVVRSKLLELKAFYQ